MKWVTRDHVHMDRVASPWLIRRFIDPAAEFSFVRFGNEHEHPLPADAIAFAIPGVEIGIHDGEGSTFRKLMRKYKLTDPALEMMAEIIESGIHHVFHHKDPGYSPADLKYPEGIGLDALAHGMMFASRNDIDNLERSVAIYEALYGYCRAMLLEKARPDIAALKPPQSWDRIKAELDGK